MDRTLAPTTCVLVLVAILAGGCDTQGNEESLPDGVVRWEENGHRYQAILVPEGISWIGAQAAVQQRGNGWHLATITSAAENAFLYDLARADSGYWNCCLSNNSTGPWLGGREVNAGTREYAWVTGEPFVYTNWGPREPFGNGDRITFFGYQTFMGPYWNDVPAERLEYGYIVENPN
jgi:hypothetical protein